MTSATSYVWAWRQGKLVTPNEISVAIQSSGDLLGSSHTIFLDEYPDISRSIDSLHNREAERELERLTEEFEQHMSRSDAANEAHRRFAQMFENWRNAPAQPNTLFMSPAMWERMQSYVHEGDVEEGTREDAQVLFRGDPMPTSENEVEVGGFYFDGNSGVVRRRYPRPDELDNDHDLWLLVYDLDQEDARNGRNLRNMSDYRASSLEELQRALEDYRRSADLYDEYVDRIEESENRGEALDDNSYLFSDQNYYAILLQIPVVVLYQYERDHQRTWGYNALAEGFLREAQPNDIPLPYYETNNGTDLFHDSVYVAIRSPYAIHGLEHCELGQELPRVLLNLEQFVNYLNRGNE